MKMQSSGLHEVLSRSDAVSLLELIHACTTCADELAFREIMGRTGALLPHDYSIAVLAGRNGGSSDAFYDAINVSYPSEWIAMYIAQREHERDPIFRANFRSFKLQYFGDILECAECPKDRRAVANDFGIVEGYVNGIRDHNNTAGSMICFSGRKVARERRSEAILELLVPHLHQAFTRISALPLATKRAVSLSPKEQEVLAWLAAGKSTWDISVLLAISERTVKFHVANILQKLDASNRAHAVAIAVERGMVNID